MTMRHMSLIIISMTFLLVMFIVSGNTISIKLGLAELILDSYHGMYCVIL